MRRGTTGTTLMQSPMFKDVVRNNVDLDTTFNRIEKSISKTMTEPNTALLFEESYIKNKIMENNCKFKVGYNANFSTNFMICICLSHILVGTNLEIFNPNIRRIYSIEEKFNIYNFL